MPTAHRIGRRQAPPIWRSEAARLWAAVAVLPPLMGVVFSAIAAENGCGNDNDTALYLFAYFLIFPFVMLGLGVLAGRATWVRRGRAWADVGAAMGGIAAFAWAIVTFWPLVIVLGFGCS